MMETFGDRMRLARKKAGLTQEQVARHVGERSHASVGHWETGRHPPTLQNLVTAAELYQVSVDWLIWGGSEMESLEARIRRIPSILREGLVKRLKDEITRTEEAASRLPAGLGHEPVRDDDERLATFRAPRGRQRRT